jgi:hypothetical protein
VKLIERIVFATVALFIGVGLLSTVLPPLMPSLIVLAVLVAALRLVWFYTRGW